MRPFARGLRVAPGILLLTASIATAYPIPPVTLWELTAGAELIVLARVDEVESPPNVEKKYAFEGHIARLQVLEVWKGSMGSEVSVTFGKNMICPAPPRYDPGETVVAFLESGTTRFASMNKRGFSAEELSGLATQWANRWFTVALSYGTLYAEADDRPFLRDLVEDAMVLQSRSPAPEAEWRAWHVRAASRRATRWQGLYALDRRSDELHSFYDRRKSRKTTPTADERREVMRGFILEPSDDHTLAMAVAFAGNQQEAEFDRAVLGQVERLLAERDVPYWLGDALARVAERFGSSNGRRDLGLKDTFEEPNAPALRSAWQRTRERYDIPEVPPAPAPARPKRGVGGSTPE